MHYNPTNKSLIKVIDLDEILNREGIEYIISYPPKYFYFLEGTANFPYYYWLKVWIKILCCQL